MLFEINLKPLKSLKEKEVGSLYRKGNRMSFLLMACNEKMFCLKIFYFFALTATYAHE